MYFELYLDVLFLVNFFMDYILLLLTGRILRCKVNHIRILAGAALGAVLYCVLILLPIPNVILEFLLFHLAVNTCMVQVGLKIKSISILLRALILMYIGAFFVGGIMEAFQQYAQIGSMIFVFAAAGYYLALGMWKFLEKLQRHASVLVSVELENKQKKMKVTALIDTGNMLDDPLTAKPVAILSKECAQEMFGEDVEGIRYIPFRTIGDSEGVIPVLCLDKIKILGEINRCIEKPLIGISPARISESGEYEMILNPNLF